MPTFRPLATLPLLACIALVLPALLAYNLPPSATFFNQAAAFIGWGAWLIALASLWPLRAGVLTRPAVAALLGALGLLAAAALAAPLWSGAPSTLSMSALGMLAAAALVALVAAAVQDAGRGEDAFAAFGLGLVVAGALSAVIAVLQIYVPDWTGSDLIAAASGRAGANLRQANHLSTLTLWAIVAVIWLGESGALRRPSAQAALLLLLVVGVVLTASRTGMLGVLLLAGWGLLDRRLARPRRVLLLLVPVAYLLLWVLSGVVPTGDGSAGFGGDQRFATGSSVLSTSRYAVWADTLALIRAHPWAGVGFGEFNFAWTLTPFADRSGEFFDHTHNLPLQFAVELGLPLAASVLALLVFALLAAFQVARAAGAEASHLRAAFMIVLIVAVHSLLEYPLWYAYFLLPAAFAFGLCLGAAPADAAAAGQNDAPAPPPRRTRPLLIAAMLLTIGGIYSVIDYWRVVVIFAPPNNAEPLSQRILDGRRSVFFGHHADYAAATSVHDPSQVMPAFRTATHYLLDTRLMLAWAKAYAARGDLDRARYLAARLREFRNPASEEFFEVCKTGTPAPFQCEPPSRPLSYRDFR